MTKTGGADQDWRDALGEGRLPAFILVCIGSWLHAADALVTATIMPSVGAELGGYAYFGWAVTGYFTGCILAGASAGRLSALIGLRAATAGAALVCAAGCLTSALAPNVGLFLAGRLIQGVGAGWVSGFCYVVIGVVFPRHHLVRILTATSAVWGAATFIGPLVGGLFAQAGAWRGVFWLFALQAAGFSAAAGVLLPPAGRRAGAPGAPLVQMALLAGALIALATAGLARSPGPLIGVGLVGLALLAAALRVDARARVQLLPRQAGDPRTLVGAGYAAIFALPAAAIGLSAYGPAIFQTLRGLSPLEAGYVAGVEALAWTGAAMASSRARGAWPDRLIVLGGLLILSASILLTVVVVHAPLAVVVAVAALQGAGFGVSWGFISQKVMGALGDDERAIGASALVAVFQAGTAAGAALTGAAANLSGFSAGLTEAAARATGLWVFMVSVPLAAAGAWAAWRVGRRPGA